MLRSWLGIELAMLMAVGVGLAGCGGKEFANGNEGGTNSGAGNSNGGNSNDSGSSNGGDGASSGEGAQAGSANPGGSAGSGGASAGCACEAGHYCREGTKDCFDCAELSRLRFGTPERLDSLSDDTQASRFPRVGEGSTDLLYSVTGAGMRYTTDSSTSAGNLVTMSQPQDSAPLLLAESVGSLGIGGATFNFVFDRLAEANKRRLYFGQWQGGLTSANEAPAPYNGGSSDFSMAIATRPTADDISRAYWMTDRDAMLGLSLVTAPLTLNAPGAPVALAVGSAACDPEKTDLTPWVTPDGKTLLFSHTRVDANCTTTNQGKDIYTALLQPTSGQPTAPAVALPDVNSPSNDVDPSFSADFCDLYFSSDRDGSYGLYRAHRR